ncbi:hypothetical protein SAMN06296036_1462 [Pseudobacteriovorax antillogorgiicola]|uniref:Uncharacterized protein n=1 Tax=Pseudobacteriovorax antillogorgiicola TaxID=1513793 RepID=A0A1Y6CQD8_9BACT|nr:hypothetical protein EDD56_14715 [Pseudobacteriovorax antillogorgiicola]SMF83306.1 hypothetical protein SAMN06296036_1462 [Pseudobacteriovorax antillogorgiicola]
MCRVKSLKVQVDARIVDKFAMVMIHSTTKLTSRLNLSTVPLALFKHFLLLLTVTSASPTSALMDEAAHGKSSKSGIPQKMRTNVY